MTREEFVRFYLPWNDQHGRRLGDDLDALIAAAREEQRAVDLVAHDACNSDCSNPYKCLCSNSSGSRIRRASLTATPLADELAKVRYQLATATDGLDTQEFDARHETEDALGAWRTAALVLGCVSLNLLLHMVIS